MLLRTASAPVLKTLLSQLPTQETDLSPRVSPTRSFSMCLKKTQSENDLKRLTISTEKIFSRNPVVSPSFVKQKEDMNQMMTVCLETASAVDVEELKEEKMVSVGGGIGGGGGGGICGGGGSGDDGGDGSWSSGHGPNGSESMDVYYQNMIKTYPGDALLLANYAKFLKEIRGDVEKAEEFCERAILANARDGNVLSMYGDLIWNNHKDGVRAQSYFDQAVQSSPDDCYVLASYARFLWDAGEEDDDDEEEDNALKDYEYSSVKKYPPLDNLTQGYPPLAAAS